MWDRRYQDYGDSWMEVGWFIVPECSCNNEWLDHATEVSKTYYQYFDGIKFINTAPKDKVVWVIPKEQNFVHDPSNHVFAKYAAYHELLHVLQDDITLFVNWLKNPIGGYHITAQHIIYEFNDIWDEDDIQNALDMFDCPTEYNNLQLIAERKGSNT